MAVLKNQRHERFAQELAKGQSGTGAYLAAGYEVSTASANAAAARLLAKVKVRDRVAEIQGKSAERVAVTVESLITEADQILKAAFAAEQFTAALGAVREKGILSGKRVERSERGIPGEFAEIDDMSPDELRAYLAAESEAVSLRRAPAESDRPGGVASAGKRASGEPIH